MEDGLAFTDELLPLSEEVLPAPDRGAHWSEKFKEDLYDFNDPEFVRQNRQGKYAFRVIPLTQGYFMIVSPRDYKKLTQYPDGSPKKWRAKIDYDSEGNVIKVYGRRDGKDGEPGPVYAHREITSALFSASMVDHRNSWGLDNRRCNLQDKASRSENGHNNIRRRTVHVGLSRGVVLLANGRFRGQHCKRLKNGKVKTIRSKVTWLKEEFAARWYENQRKRLYGGRKTWASNPKSVNYPVFPPRMDSEPIARRSRRISSAQQMEDVPF